MSSAIICRGVCVVIPPTLNPSITIIAQPPKMMAELINVDVGKYMRKDYG
jgi:hypothetical protein